jgi:drug/metabolite transporter (DMT)-like permease
MADRPAFPPGLGVAVAVLSVSFAAPLFRMAEADAVTASFWRLLLAVGMLAPFALRAWPAWAAYGRRDWLATAAAGVALALHFALWVQSLQMTSVAAATALVTLQAVFVAAGGHFLGDRIGAAGAAGVALATAGGLAIAWGDAGAGGTHALRGDLLAVLAGICSAAYMLIGRRLRQGRGLLEYAVPVYAIAAAALGLAALALRLPLLPSGPGAARSFGLFVLLAAVPMLGGHTVANWAIRWLPAHTVATWILLEPVGAALLAWPLLGEVPGPWTVAGGAVVILGGALTIPRTRAPAAEPAG